MPCLLEFDRLMQYVIYNNTILSYTWSHVNFPSYAFTRAAAHSIPTRHKIAINGAAASRFLSVFKQKSIIHETNIEQNHADTCARHSTRVHRDTFFLHAPSFLQAQALFFKQRTIRFKSLERNKIFVSASTEKHSKGLCEFFTVI